jgi:hypothetical protein
MGWCWRGDSDSFGSSCGCSVIKYLGSLVQINFHKYIDIKKFLAQTKGIVRFLLTDFE